MNLQKRLLPIVFVFTVFLSCQKGASDNSFTAQTIEGEYWDTVSYISPFLNFSDSLIRKTIYKINDSVYWMPMVTCTDSGFACPPWEQSVNKRLVILLKPDSSFLILADMFNGNFDPLTYGCSDSSYVRGDYLYVDRCYNGPGANERRETHRLRRR